MERLSPPFRSLALQVLRDLAGGACVSIVGLSNTGKSLLLRSLAGEEAAHTFAEVAGRPALLVYVDCNQAVAASPQAFYEVVLRSMLEAVPSSGSDLALALQEHHEAVTDADSAFSASLAFNLALVETCDRLGRALCLLIDEFDELYVRLDDRALLNLRALRDRFRQGLAFATATLRSLPELRGGASEDEFAEMFGGSTYLMPPLSAEETGELLGRLRAEPASGEMRALCFRLSGGHPGLTVALGHALTRVAPGPEPDLARALTQEPGVRAECLKLWTQLRPEEQADLQALALEHETGARLPQLARLERLGLVREGRMFSPIFAEFVGRRSRAAEVAAEGVHIDSDSGDVWVDGVRIPLLTDLEFRLLQANPRYLVTQRGRGYKLLSRPRAAGTAEA